MNIFYLFIVLILLVVTFFILNRWLKSTNWYRNQFVDSQKFLTDIPNNLEVINLGSTQPKFAFDYSGTDLLGMNWALGPQPFDYDFKILRQYHAHLRDGAFVLIPVCPFKFFVDTYSNDATNKKYYPFLNTSMINNYSVKQKRRIVDYPLLSVGKQALRVIKDVPEDKRMMMQINPLSAESIGQDADYWMDGWKKEFGIQNLNSFSLSQENKASIEYNVEKVREMLLFCQENNYRPIFILLPSTKELNSKFPNAYIQEYVLGSIAKSNITNVPIMNYFGDERFSSSDYYINSFFFNTKGRIAFTKVVTEDLKKLNN